MKTYRVSNVDNDRLAIPYPINISELITIKEFEGALIHFTMPQWKLTIDQLEKTDDVIPEKAILMTATALPSGYGVIANIFPRDPFFQCPPGCHPAMGRGQVCPNIYPPGYTPNPDCYFEPRCSCPKDIEESAPPNVPWPSPLACLLKFTPVKIQLDDGVFDIFGTTRLDIKCERLSGECAECRPKYSISSRRFSIGCVCSR